MATRLIDRILVATAAAGLAIAPAAGADPGMPGGPDTHCKGYGLGNTAMACDGPIQPDGTWRRCMQWQPQPFFNGEGGMGGFIPGGSDCVTLGGENPPPNPFTPQNHIDG
ncbi:MAG TPA: hypothetical protein VFR17_14110 [Mycobacterium sp.]|nr:hypothetical protein [Mycobacterium sp.]